MWGHTPIFSDANRIGMERCPHCGGYHQTNAEIYACSTTHACGSGVYHCKRCGRPYSTRGEADACCEEEKYFGRACANQNNANGSGGLFGDSQDTEAKVSSSESDPWGWFTNFGG